MHVVMHSFSCIWLCMHDRSHMHLGGHYVVYDAICML